MRDITVDDIVKQWGGETPDPKEFSKYLTNETVSTKIGALFMSCDMKIRYRCSIEGIPIFGFRRKLPNTYCLYEGPLDSQRWPHGYGSISNGDVTIKGIFYHGEINDNHAVYKTANETTKIPILRNHRI